MSTLEKILEERHEETMRKIEELEKIKVETEEALKKYRKQVEELRKDMEWAKED